MKRHSEIWRGWNFWSLSPAPLSPPWDDQSPVTAILRALGRLILDRT